MLTASAWMLICARFEFPQQRITINLAPADLLKEGSRFDRPIALGILAADGQSDTQSLDKNELLAELAVTGKLCGVDGVLPAAITATRDRRSLIVAAANSEEAALTQHADVRGRLQACRALEAAAAGGQHLLLLGATGCGKMLLASRLPSILPAASKLEVLEVATITSCSGQGLDAGRW